MNSKNSEITRTNGQFDCVVETKEGLDFYECRYYDKPMKISECNREAEQMMANPGIDPNRIGFICSSGFASSSNKYELIKGKELFSNG